MTDLLEGMARSWPAEREVTVGPWRLRVAPDGGNRVTCAVADAPVTGGDVAALAAAAAALGQRPTVMLREGEARLDAALADAGWAMGEDVVLHAAPVAAFAPVSPMAAFAVWPPLAVQRDFWAMDGIGPAKWAVMDRAPTPRTAILGRHADRPAGAAFVALAGTDAFLHALVTAPALRRQGAGRAMVQAAARWAADAGATRLVLAVTRGNGPARTLYSSLGMVVVGQYHYRVL